MKSLLRGGPSRWPPEAEEEFAPAFLTACRDHGVGPLLHRRLADEGSWEGWPEAVRGRLKTEEGGALLLQEILDRELARVLGTLPSKLVPESRKD